MTTILNNFNFFTLQSKLLVSKKSKKFDLPNSEFESDCTNNDSIKYDYSEQLWPNYS
jgi:hypothetical protein